MICCAGENNMSGQDDPGVAPHQQERAISSLIEATSVPPEEVRALFMREFAKDIRPAFS